MVLNYIRISETSMKTVESEEKQDQPMTIEVVPVCATWPVKVDHNHLAGKGGTGVRHLAGTFPLPPGLRVGPTL
jgi:hypothetical protein